MTMCRTLVAAAVSMTLLVGSRRSSDARLVAAPNACSLLTEAEVSAALEVTTLPGRPPIATSTTTCIWSDDATGAVDHRRVTLSIIRNAAFDIAKGSASSRVTIVPVSGIGEEAYYEMFRSESPMLNARKGSSSIQIRILNGLKLKPFTIDQDKAKEADLAKAAVARL